MYVCVCAYTGNGYLIKGTRVTRRRVRVRIANVELHAVDRSALFVNARRRLGYIHVYAQCARVGKGDFCCERVRRCKTRDERAENSCQQCLFHRFSRPVVVIEFRRRPVV